MLADLPLSNFQVHDDDSFTFLYDSFSKILLSAASSTFQLPSPPNPCPRLRNQTIRLLVREIRRVGRLIFAAKSEPSALDQLCARCPLGSPLSHYLLCPTTRSPPQPAVSFTIAVHPLSISYSQNSQ